MHPMQRKRTENNVTENVQTTTTRTTCHLLELN
jgi:hypothetical protein